MLEFIKPECDAEVKNLQRAVLVPLRLSTQLSADTIRDYRFQFRMASLSDDKELMMVAQDVIKIAQSHLEQANSKRRKIQQALTQYSWGNVWPSTR